MCGKNVQTETFTCDGSENQILKPMNCSRPHSIVNVRNKRGCEVSLGAKWARTEPIRFYYCIRETDGMSDFSLANIFILVGVSAIGGGKTENLTCFFRCADSP